MKKEIKETVRLLANGLIDINEADEILLGLFNVRVCCLCGANFTPSAMYPKDAACGNCHKKLRGY